MDPIELRLRNNSTARRRATTCCGRASTLTECYHRVGAHPVSAGRTARAARPRRRRLAGWPWDGPGPCSPAIRFPRRRSRSRLRDDDTAVVATSGSDSGHRPVDGAVHGGRRIAGPSRRTRVTPRLGDSAFPPGRHVPGGSTATRQARARRSWSPRRRRSTSLLAVASAPRRAVRRPGRLLRDDGRVLAAGRSMTFGEFAARGAPPVDLRGRFVGAR